MNGAYPFVLILGADATPIAMQDLQKYVLLQDGLQNHELHSINKEKMEKLFNDAWNRMSSMDRFAALLEVFENSMGDPAQCRKKTGYDALAKLIEQGYFDVILTSSMDTLLEDALIQLGLKCHFWQAFINEREDLDKIKESLEYPTPKVKIVKLSGDMFYRIYNFADKENNRIEHEIDRFFQSCLARPVLLVGQDLEEPCIDKFVAKVQDACFYVNVKQPESFNAVFEEEMRGITCICGEEADFSFFFSTLSRKLLGGRKLKTFPPVDIIDVTAIDPAQDPSKNPLVKLYEPSIFFLEHASAKNFRFRIEGVMQYCSEQGEMSEVDPVELNKTMTRIGRDIAKYHEDGDQVERDSWREEAKKEGMLLYRKLFAKNPNLMQSFGRACKAVEKEHDLHLCFAGPRNFIGMPYELLYDDSGPLATRYPICRKIDKVETSTTSFNSLLVKLNKDNKPLRVLIIASNTRNFAVDAEAAMLKDLIEKNADDCKIRHAIKVVPTEEASLPEIDKLLNGCDYHVVHYAGHGKFDAATGENSGLLFWNEPHRRGGTGLMTARALAQRLSGSETILFYVSACVGAATGDEDLLRGNDYLGIMDALVQAGVPNVLGFRWFVTDSGAQKFAALFYDELFKTWSPSRATLHARKMVYANEALNETWMSPILVAQKI